MDRAGLRRRRGVLDWPLPAGPPPAAPRGTRCSPSPHWDESGSLPRNARWLRGVLHAPSAAPPDCSAPRNPPDSSVGYDAPWVPESAPGDQSLLRMMFAAELAATNAPLHLPHGCPQPPAAADDSDSAHCLQNCRTCTSLISSRASPNEP